MEKRQRIREPMKFPPLKPKMDTPLDKTSMFYAKF
jgi:hypothetical protein